jgi:hypothetical protein
MISGFCGRNCRARKSSSNERGLALALAVFALAVIGALVSGTYFVGRLEQQSGQNVLFAAQAAEAAEAGLNEAVATVAVPALEGLAVGGPPLDLGELPLAPGVSARRWVTRLTGGLLLVRAQGVRQDMTGTPLAVRSLGLLVRLLRGADSTASATLVPLRNRGWVQLY